MTTNNLENLNFTNKKQKATMNMKFLTSFKFNAFVIKNWQKQQLACTDILAIHKDCAFWL